MYNVSSFRRFIIGIVGVLMSFHVSAEMGTNTYVGYSGTSAWNAGVGLNFDSPWGIDVDLGSLSDLSVGDGNVIEQKWYSVSPTYTVDDLFWEGLSLKGSLGIGNILRSSSQPKPYDHDIALVLIPSVELDYRLTTHWQMMAGYRYFSEVTSSAWEDVEPMGTAYVGFRYSWGRNDPILTVLDDESVTPSLAKIRDTSIAQLEQTQNVLDGYGMSPSACRFYVHSDEGVQWNRLRLIMDDETAWDIPLEKGSLIGQLAQRLPKGKHTLDFYLEGNDSETGEKRLLSTSSTVELYNSQGLNFVLSVSSNFISEVLNVQAF
ncbi:MAG: hypothetical protein ACK5NL_04640 [Vibrio fluvialis]